jgi:hypothetical protein
MKGSMTVTEGAFTVKSAASLTARFALYPSLLYNMARNRLQDNWHWWDRITEVRLLQYLASCFPERIVLLSVFCPLLLTSLAFHSVHTARSFVPSSSLVLSRLFDLMRLPCAAQHVILGALPFASMLDTLRDKVRAACARLHCHAADLGLNSTLQYSCSTPHVATSSDSALRPVHPAGRARGGHAERGV